jgi:hypothetical protein
MINKGLLAIVGAAIGFTLTAAAAERPKVDITKLPPPAQKKNVTFASDIKPLFEQSCVKCHGGEKPKGKLRLDSLEGALKGSERGSVLKSGKSADSLLVHSVARIGDPDNHMPPPNNKANIGPLTPEQVGLIRAWVDQGAK